LAEQLTLNQ